MNIIKAIQDINKKLDYLISKGELMTVANTLQTELSHAKSIIDKSRTLIAGLIKRAETAEANLATHAVLLANSSSLESDVSNVASNFSSVFSEFETYLNSLSANTSANVTVNVASNTTPVVNVASVVVETATVIHANTVISTPHEESLVEGVVHDIEQIPAEVKAAAVDVESDVTRIVHNIDPRLLHTTAVANTVPSSN